MSRVRMGKAGAFLLIGMVMGNGSDQGLSNPDRSFAFTLMLYEPLVVHDF